MIRRTLRLACLLSILVLPLAAEALALQLLSEDPVLLYEVVDEVLLVAINPSSEKREQQP